MTGFTNTEKAEVGLIDVLPFLIVDELLAKSGRYEKTQNWGVHVVTDGLITQCRAHHSHQEFLGFLKHIEANVPMDLDIHFVVDNYRLLKQAEQRAAEADISPAGG